MGLYKNSYFYIYYLCLSKNICLDITGESVFVYIHTPDDPHLEIILT